MKCWCFIDKCQRSTSLRHHYILQKLPLYLFSSTCRADGGNSLSREVQTLISLGTSTNSSSGRIISQPRDIITPMCPGSAQGAPPGWTSTKHLHKKKSGRDCNLMPKPPQLIPLSSSLSAQSSNGALLLRTIPAITQGKLNSAACMCFLWSLNRACNRR